VATASACGLEIREYPVLLKNDPAYHDKAIMISGMVQDISQFMASAETHKLKVKEILPEIRFHAPCTLQHGLKQNGTVETVLQELGFSVKTPMDAHLCCGSAGTYSVMQPKISMQLRDNKLEKLEADSAEIIATANIGCMMHLQSGTKTEVRHWIEVLDASLQPE
jgi:glycolate oxidase iron-sulfur subunit